MIALICSVQAEVENLLQDISVSQRSTVGSKPIIKGLFCQREILLCVCGMGKVNAAHAATLLVTQYACDAFLLFGIGGAYPSSGAAVGDVALANEEIAGDEGVMIRDGFKDTEYIGIPLMKTDTSSVYSTFPATERLVKQSLDILLSRRESSGNKVHVGTFVTLSTCSGTVERAGELEKRYRGLCENMEGAAVAQIAGLHGVPWMEVRGISNIVENRDLTKWNIPEAALAAQRAVRRIVENWMP